MNRSRTLGALSIVALFLVMSLGHLAFSEWLVRRRHWELLGEFRMLDFLPAAGGVLVVALAVWQIRKARRGGALGATAGLWLAWLAAVLLVDRWLIYAHTEWIHYPQYALLAGLLARLHDPDRRRFAIGPVLLAIVMLGIADETLQYTWITVAYSNYLDFNDMLLNLLGGLAGLLLYYGFLSAPYYDPVHPRAGVCHGLTGFVLLAACFIAFIGFSERPQSENPGSRAPSLMERKAGSYGHWLKGPYRGRYFVLEPWDGLLLMFGLGTAATALPLLALRRRR